MSFFITKLLRPGLTLIGTVLIVGALLHLRGASADIVSREGVVQGTPITIFRVGPASIPRPTILISHGFAGSQQLMLSYAQALAKRGYLAVTFDYLGHGRHPEALRGDITQVDGATQALIAQTRAAADFALAQPEADGRLALLGHSMASDIIVRYAAQDPRVDSTIAISMFSTAVTADEPRNLLVVVGGLEGFLKEEALRVLGLVTSDPRPRATVGDFSAGTARRVAFAPGVEHVGVLYSRDALSEVIHWLDAVFSRPASNSAFAFRGLAIVALLVGLATLAWPLSTLLPKLVDPPRGASLTWRELAIAALVPAIVTPLVLVRFPADFMGVLVGGYLAVHFLTYGLIGGACLWVLRGRRTGPGAPVIDSQKGGNVAFVVVTLLVALYLAGAFAWALDAFVTSYAITPTRWPLVAATFAGTLAYFLADEWIAHGDQTVTGAHLVTRLCFLLSLGLAVALSFDELFFLLIIAAVIVIYFLVYGFFSRWVYKATGHPAVGAIANAVAFAWALGAVFPFLAQ